MQLLGEKLLFNNILYRYIKLIIVKKIYKSNGINN